MIQFKEQELKDIEQEIKEITEKTYRKNEENSKQEEIQDSEEDKEHEEEQEKMQNGEMYEEKQEEMQDGEEDKEHEEEQEKMQNGEIYEEEQEERQDSEEGEMYEGYWDTHGNFVRWDDLEASGEKKKLSERAKDLTKEYASTTLKTVTSNTKIWLNNQKNKMKNKIDSIYENKVARKIKGVKKVVAKVYKGVKITGYIIIGAGAITIDALKNAKNTVDKVRTSNPKGTAKEIINSAKNKTDVLLGKIEEKILGTKTKNEEEQQQFREKGR